MSAVEVRKEKCWACYRILAYLAGYCPVCNDTGFVEVESRDPDGRRREEAGFRFPAVRDESISPAPPGLPA